MSPSIKKIFIANRGEICRRVAIAAKQLGIESAAMVDPEKPTQYLREWLTESVYIPRLATQHYLDSDLVLSLAKQSGCDAIHPGYGYLSENFEFAKKVVAAGLTWIGPHSESMASMASKAVARDIAEKGGVPCLKALKFKDVAEVKKRESELQKFASDIGYPVLIKAALGGGGKGMRIVRGASELIAAAERASSEAVNAFGNPEIIVEKYVENPRHVEVQLLCDKHGHYFAIGDRDCSVQRRHQKIIEEAPAPELTEVTRKKLHAAATALAAEVGYDSVGTVEFLLDWSPGARDLPEQKFYFLEMNTRLQVEHPVTEECYGIDLVQWQIKVAAGAVLPENFSHLQPSGHVVELRIYAEDCDQGFLPAPGPVDLFLPDHSLPVRWDVGLDAIDKISPEFDPMIAKLIVKAADRGSAFATAALSLEKSVIAGTSNNQSFLVQICRNQNFLAGAVSTSYLEQNLTDLLNSQKDKRHCYEGVAGRLLNWLSSSAEPWLSVTGTAHPVVDRTNYIFGTDTDRSRAASGIIVANRELKTVGREKVQYGHLLVSDDRIGLVHFYQKNYPSFIRYGVLIAGEKFFLDCEKSGLDRFAGAHDAEHSAVSPVPGKVVAIHYKEGESVRKNEVVIILESMKMEFEVKADDDRIIEKLLVKSGDQVDSGAALVRWQE